MPHPKNILVTSFGLSWQIIPELIGFLNHKDFPLYQNHPQWEAILQQLGSVALPHVDCIYVVHSDSEPAKLAITHVKQWAKHMSVALPDIYYYSYKGVSELYTPEECNQMTDLIFRTVLHARAACNGGKLILSLTGGRKNMSADMQWASEIFGCDAMVHVADSLTQYSPLKNKEFDPLLLQPFPSDIALQLFPMVMFGFKKPHSLLAVDKQITPENFSLTKNEPVQPRSDLYQYISQGLHKSRNLLFNHYHQQNIITSQSTFHGLQVLGPDAIMEMQGQFIGRDFNRQTLETTWLKTLPKAELHCHLGGVLNPKELIDVACTLKNEVNLARKSNPAFDQFLTIVALQLENKDYQPLKRIIDKAKRDLRQIKGVPEPLGTAGFLQIFERKADILDQLLFGLYSDERNYQSIGINAYEKLGDLQGTGILKHPKTLAKTCELLKKYCLRENILYLELRCSPANYATSSFSIDKVIEVIQNSLTGCSHTLFKLIIIASRHNREELILEHVDYVLNNIDRNQPFRNFFAGFDVAGDEKAQSPIQIKKHLDGLLKKSIQMTIHAGESVEVANVWEAVYELNADRIGHGLTLKDDKRLLQRFVNRRITVEMCPSSNYQIVGFRDYRYDNTQNLHEYPLHQYFQQGIRVSLNTDNPGISRTTLTNEYYKAACMIKGGISKWDLLKIVRNGFISAFIPFEQKKSLLLKAEEYLINSL